MLNLANYSSTNVSSSTKINLEIGEIAYFLVNLSDYLPYVFLSSIGTILGCLGKNSNLNNSNSSKFL